MGFTRPRHGCNGVTRYQALFDDVKGHRRSAGTFATEKAANKAWQRAETRMAEGRMGNPSGGRQRFRTYVEDEWFPNHQMEARTRENYSYCLDLHILPWFGSMRMIEVMPADVREWITHLQNQKVSAHVIRYCKTILGAIFTTALNDVVHLHPVRGVKSPAIAKRTRSIVTPEQFDKIYLALPSGTMNEEMADLMKEKGVAHVPTLAVVEALLSDATSAGLDASIANRVGIAQQGQIDAIKASAEAGVLLGSGSDLIGPRQLGRGRELTLRSAVQSPIAALVSATRDNARILCIADQVGTIEVGKVADLVIWSADPLAEPEVFSDRDAVAVVVQSGRIVRDVRGC